MLFFMCENNPLFQFSLKFEEHDLSHTHIEVCLDGFAYRFPKEYMRVWLDRCGIEWKWECKKTEIWKGEPHCLAIEPSSKPPIMKFATEDNAAFFRLTWDIK